MRRYDSLVFLLTLEEYKLKKKEGREPKLRSMLEFQSSWCFGLSPRMEPWAPSMALSLGSLYTYLNLPKPTKK